jgi:hypothetical protein
MPKFAANLPLMLAGHSFLDQVNAAATLNSRALNASFLLKPGREHCRQILAVEFKPSSIRPTTK